MKIGLSKEKIKEILPNHDLITEPSHGIVELKKWAIPHWDWVTGIGHGAIKVSRPTAEYIIGRLVTLFPDKKQEISFLWINYGFSISHELKDWKCSIDFNKVKYKE